MKKSILILLGILAVFLLSGCYINNEVSTSQIGVRLVRNEITKCEGAGVYTAWGFWDDLKTVSMDTLTFKVSDPEVATLDNQLVGIEITIQARRKNDCDSVKTLLTKWSSLNTDENLINVITATASEGIKVGARQFTLTELLNDRNGLSDSISKGISEDTVKYSTELVNVTVSNIDLADEYAAKMQAKALLTADIELEARRQDVIRQKASNDKLEQDQRALVLIQKLLAEQAQTAVDVEIASREGKKTSAANQVYLDNSAAYELERLTRYERIFGDKSVFYFLPEGTDVTMLYGMGNMNVLPVPESPVTTP